MASLRHAALLIAACVFLQFCLTVSAHAAEYAPLNCARAASDAEKAICSDYALGQDEARMATLYALATALVAMGQRGIIQDEQRAFLRERDACRSDVGCIRNVYRVRIGQLDAVLSRIVQRGPF